MENHPLIQPLLDYSIKYGYNLYCKSKLKAIEFPSEVWIENTNHCNADCVMCPRESMTRKCGFMPLGLYEKLIREISRYNVKRVHLHNFGEPLLDKELPDRIKIAKNHGIKHTFLVTNGSLLFPDVSASLIKAGLDEFKISFYGTDSKTYNETMRGLDFEKTLQNIRIFFKIRRELNSSTPKITIRYLPQKSNKEKTGDFFKIFRPMINKHIGDKLEIYRLHNYGGGKDYYDLGRALMACGYLWNIMVILYDGKVVKCCMDYDGTHAVGDVNKSSIREIWNSDELNKVREDFKRLNYKEYATCIKCDEIRFSKKRHNKRVSGIGSAPAFGIL